MSYINARKTKLNFKKFEYFRIDRNHFEKYQTLKEQIFSDARKGKKISTDTLEHLFLYLEELPDYETLGFMADVLDGATEIGVALLRLKQPGYFFRDKQIIEGERYEFGMTEAIENVMLKVMKWDRNVPRLPRHPKPGQIAIERHKYTGRILLELLKRRKRELKDKGEHYLFYKKLTTYKMTIISALIAHKFFLEHENRKLKYTAKQYYKRSGPAIQYAVTYSNRFKLDLFEGLRKK